MGSGSSKSNNNNSTSTNAATTTAKPNEAPPPPPPPPPPLKTSAPSAKPRQTPAAPPQQQQPQPSPLDILPAVDVIPTSEYMAQHNLFQLLDEIHSCFTSQPSNPIAALVTATEGAIASHLIRRYDSDMSGTFDRAEMHPLLEALFSSVLDTDGEGKHATTTISVKQEDVGRMFELMDSNNDGNVSQEELARWWHKHAKPLIQILDVSSRTKQETVDKTMKMSFREVTLLSRLAHVLPQTQTRVLDAFEMFLDMAENNLRENPKDCVPYSLLASTVVTDKKKDNATTGGTGGDVKKFGGDLANVNPTEEALQALPIFPDKYMHNDIEQALQDVGLRRGEDYAMCLIEECWVISGVNDFPRHVKEYHPNYNYNQQDGGEESTKKKDGDDAADDSSSLWKHPTIDDVIAKGRRFWDTFVRKSLPSQYPRVKRNHAIALYVYTLETELYRDMNYGLRMKNTVLINRFLPLMYHIVGAFDVIPKHDLMVSQLYRGLDCNLQGTYNTIAFTRWTAFSSTTASHSVVESFLKSTKGKLPDGSIFLIRSRQGILIKDFSEFPKENEVLLPPNTLLKVEGEVKAGVKELLSKQLAIPLNDVFICELRDACEDDIKKYRDKNTIVQTNIWLNLQAGNTEALKKVLHDGARDSFTKPKLEDWVSIKESIVTPELVVQSCPNTKPNVMAVKFGYRCPNRHLFHNFTSSTTNATNSAFEKKKCCICNKAPTCDILACMMCRTFVHEQCVALVNVPSATTTAARTFANTIKSDTVIDMTYESLLTIPTKLYPALSVLWTWSSKARWGLLMMRSSTTTISAIDTFVHTTLVDCPEREIILCDGEQWQGIRPALLTHAFLTKLSIKSVPFAWRSVSGLRCSKGHHLIPYYELGPHTHTEETHACDQSWFTCGRTEPIGPWDLLCQYCDRRICSKCVRRTTKWVSPVSFDLLANVGEGTMEFKADTLCSVPTSLLATPSVLKACDAKSLGVLVARLLEVTPTMSLDAYQPKSLNITSPELWTILPRAAITPMFFTKLAPRSWGYAIASLVRPRCPIAGHVLGWRGGTGKCSSCGKDPQNNNSSTASSTGNSKFIFSCSCPSKTRYYLCKKCYQQQHVPAETLAAYLPICDKQFDLDPKIISWCPLETFSEAFLNLSTTSGHATIIKYMLENYLYIASPTQHLARYMKYIPKDSLAFPTKLMTGSRPNFTAHLRDFITCELLSCIGSVPDRSFFCLGKMIPCCSRGDSKTALVGGLPRDCTVCKSTVMHYVYCEYCSTAPEVVCFDCLHGTPPSAESMEDVLQLMESFDDGTFSVGNDLDSTLWSVHPTILLHEAFLQKCDVKTLQSAFCMLPYLKDELSQTVYDVLERRNIQIDTSDYTEVPCHWRSMKSRLITSKLLKHTHPNTSGAMLMYAYCGRQCSKGQRLENAAFIFSKNRSLMCDAATAVLTANVTLDPGSKCIAWKGADGVVTWDVTLPRTGEYSVTVHYAEPVDDNIRIVAEFINGGATDPAVLTSTGSVSDHESRTIGKMVGEIGSQVLKLCLFCPNSETPFPAVYCNLQSVTLTFIPPIFRCSRCDDSNATPLNASKRINKSDSQDLVLKPEDAKFKKMQLVTGPVMGIQWNVKNFGVATWEDVNLTFGGSYDVSITCSNTSSGTGGASSNNVKLRVGTVEVEFQIGSTTPNEFTELSNIATVRGLKPGNHKIEFEIPATFDSTAFQFTSVKLTKARRQTMLESAPSFVVCDAQPLDEEKPVSFTLTSKENITDKADVGIQSGNIGFLGATGYVTWSVNVEQPGMYSASILVSCRPEGEGDMLSISDGTSLETFKLMATGATKTATKFETLNDVTALYLEKGQNDISLQACAERHHPAPIWCVQSLTFSKIVDEKNFVRNVEVWGYETRDPSQGLVLHTDAPSCPLGWKEYQATAAWPVYVARDGTYSVSILYSGRKCEGTDMQLRVGTQTTKIKFKNTKNDEFTELQNGAFMTLESGYQDLTLQPVEKKNMEVQTVCRIKKVTLTYLPAEVARSMRESIDQMNSLAADSDSTASTCEITSAHVNPIPGSLALDENVMGSPVFWKQCGAKAVWHVTFPHSGWYNVDFVYANPCGEGNDVFLFVGKNTANFKITATTSWYQPLELKAVTRIQAEAGKQVVVITTGPTFHSRLCNLFRVVFTYDTRTTVGPLKEFHCCSSDSCSCHSQGNREILCLNCAVKQPGRIEQLAVFEVLAAPIPDHSLEITNALQDTCSSYWLMPILWKKSSSVMQRALLRALLTWEIQLTEAIVEGIWPHVLTSSFADVTFPMNYPYAHLFAKCELTSPKMSPSVRTQILESIMRPMCCERRMTYILRDVEEDDDDSGGGGDDDVCHRCYQTDLRDKFHCKICGINACTSCISCQAVPENNILAVEGLLLIFPNEKIVHDTDWIWPLAYCVSGTYFKKMDPNSRPKLRLTQSFTATLDWKSLSSLTLKALVQLGCQETLACCFANLFGKKCECGLFVCKSVSTDIASPSCCMCSATVELAKMCQGDCKHIYCKTCFDAPADVSEKDFISPEELFEGCDIIPGEFVSEQLRLALGSLPSTIAQHILIKRLMTPPPAPVAIVDLPVGVPIRAKCHTHPLVLFNRDNGWGCDGRSLPGGCKRGCTGFRQSYGWTRYRCEACDYDLCDECLRFHLFPQVQDASGPNGTTTTDPEKAVCTVGCHPHVLKLVNRDNGWGCDGRKLAGGCKRGCTGFRQSYGWGRYRCESCDYDLCDECVTAHVVSWGAPKPPHMFVDCHTHCLRIVSTDTPAAYSGWRCDGRHLPSGCCATNPVTTTTTRYHCATCQYDLCEECATSHHTDTITVDCHAHKLRLVTAAAPAAYNSWGCDGRSLPSSKCYSKKPISMASRYHCPGCKFDLCEDCAIAHKTDDATTGAPPEEATNEVKVSCHPHTLLKCFDDNGWGCDGRKLPGGCKRGCTGFHQSYGWGRFRCEDCDFDLCDKCVASLIER